MISVAMTSFNGEKHIKNQIQSILDNLTEYDELVISDDGSTDSTIEIINSFNDERIKLIKGPHEGINKNFENAIKACRGEYIFLSDQDDFWYSNKSNIVLDKLKNGYVLVQHDARVVDGNDSVLIDSFSKYRRVRSGLLKNIIRNTYHGCLIAFSSKLKDYIMPFPKHGCFHDQWIGLIANIKGETVFIDDILVDYRRYGENQSSFKQYPIIVQVRNRLLIIINLILFSIGINKRL